MTRSLYPPRPGHTLPPSDLGAWEGRYPWVGELKFNGTRIVVYREGSEVRLATRHLTAPAQYTMSAETRADLLALPEGIYDGELLHSKTTGIKDRVVLWDLLGPSWIGVTYSLRRAALQALFGNPTGFETQTGRQIALRVTDHLWTPYLYTRGLVNVFESFTDLAEIEGLVLKNMEAPLARPLAVDNNGDWQIRFRKPSKIYTF